MVRIFLYLDLRIQSEYRKYKPEKFNSIFIPIQLSEMNESLRVKEKKTDIWILVEE